MSHPKSLAVVHYITPCKSVAEVELSFKTVVAAAHSTIADAEEAAADYEIAGGAQVLMIATCRWTATLPLMKRETAARKCKPHATEIESCCSAAIRRKMKTEPVDAAG